MAASATAADNGYQQRSVRDRLRRLEDQVAQQQHQQQRPQPQRRSPTVQPPLPAPRHQQAPTGPTPAPRTRRPSADDDLGLNQLFAVPSPPRRVQRRNNNSAQQQYDIPQPHQVRERRQQLEQQQAAAAAYGPPPPQLSRPTMRLRQDFQRRGSGGQTMDGAGGVSSAPGRVANRLQAFHAQAQPPPPRADAQRPTMRLRQQQFQPQQLAGSGYTPRRMSREAQALQSVRDRALQFQRMQERATPGTGYRADGYLRSGRQLATPVVTEFAEPAPRIPPTPRPPMPAGRRQFERPESEQYVLSGAPLIPQTPRPPFPAGAAPYGSPQTPQTPRTPRTPQTPQYGTPQTPQYGTPQTPQYETPQTPRYGTPKTPQYGTPGTPQYDSPESPGSVQYEYQDILSEDDDVFLPNTPPPASPPGTPKSTRYAGSPRTPAEPSAKRRLFG